MTIKIIYMYMYVLYMLVYTSIDHMEGAVQPRYPNWDGQGFTVPVEDIHLS